MSRHGRWRTWLWRKLLEAFAIAMIVDVSGCVVGPQIASPVARCPHPSPPTWKPAKLDFRAFANLCNARLRGADLRTIILRHANLSGADLSHAQLNNADLSDSDLRTANLNYANATNADLFGANLSRAQLLDVNIAGAKLAYTNLANAIYSPASQPPDAYVAGIQGLEAVKIFQDDLGLVQLRKLLQDAGLRDAEREATFSIERGRTRDLLSSRPWWHFAWMLGGLRLLGFEWSVGYGLCPWLSLIEILALGAALTLVYASVIPRTSKKSDTPAASAESVATAAPGRPASGEATVASHKSGIYQILPSDRIDDTSAKPTLEKDPDVIRVKATDPFDALRKAAYFSLLSAVNIGFEQFTPGDWIRRLQQQDYTLDAVGWVRVVAGAQALLSVYLLAMWVLTQFGRPFD
jgi:hypothetical protein